MLIIRISMYSRVLNNRGMVVIRGMAAIFWKITARGVDIKGVKNLLGWKIENTDC